MSIKQVYKRIGHKLYDKKHYTLCLLMCPSVYWELAANDFQAGMNDMISHADEFCEYCIAHPNITNASKQRAMKAFIDKYYFGIASPSLLFSRGVKYEWDWLFKPERIKDDGNI